MTTVPLQSIFLTYGLGGFESAIYGSFGAAIIVYYSGIKSH